MNDNFAARNSESLPSKWKKSAYIKEAVLGVGVVCFSFASGYFWRSIGSIGAENGTFNTAIYAEIASIFLLACFFVLYSLVYVKKTPFCAILMGSSVLLFVSYPFQNVFGAGMAASALFFFISSAVIRREADSQARLHWHSILRTGISTFFTGLGIAFAILFFATLSPSEKLHNAVIPKPVFNAFMPFLEGSARGVMPGFSLAGTVDETILNVIKEGARADIDVGRLPKAQVQQFITAQRADLNRQFGTRLTGQEKVSDALYIIIAKKLDEYMAPYKKYVPAAISLGYFITLRFVFMLFAWILYLMFPLVVFALTRAGFLVQKRAMIEKESVTL